MSDSTEAAGCCGCIAVAAFGIGLPSLVYGVCGFTWPATGGMLLVVAAMAAFLSIKCV